MPDVGDEREAWVALGDGRPVNWQGRGRGKENIMLQRRIKQLPTGASVYVTTLYVMRGRGRAQLRPSRMDEWSLWPLALPAPPRQPLTFRDPSQYLLL